MDPLTLNKRIQDLDFSPVYIFTGEDVYRKKNVANKLLAALKLDDFNITKEDCSKLDMDAVLTTANTSPVFNAQRFILLTSVEKLKPTAKDALLKYMSDPLSSTIMVLSYDDDKKWKAESAFKKTSAAVVEFAELKGAALSGFINNKLKEKNLNAGFDVCEMLAESLGSDSSAIEMEVEKLSLFKGGAGGSLTSEDVLASIGFNKEENPFALSNAIMAQDKKTAMALIASMLEAGEEPVGMLNKISSCVMKMARIKRLLNRGVSAAEIPSKAGLMFWEGRLVQSAKAFPPEDVLLKTLDKIIAADMTLKSSRAGDPGVLLRGIILGFLK